MGVSSKVITKYVSQKKSFPARKRVTELKTLAFFDPLGFLYFAILDLISASFQKPRSASPISILLSPLYELGMEWSVNWAI